MLARRTQPRSRASSGRNDAGCPPRHQRPLPSASARDNYHDRAQEIVRGIDHGNLPDVMMTNYVVAEMLNLTGEKLGPDAANEMLDRLIEGAHFEIDHDRKRISTLFRPSSTGTWSSHSSIRPLRHTWNEKVSSTSTRSTMISTRSTPSRG